MQILGYDVVCQKNPAGYYLGSREFELAELKLLVDAVQASKFITQKQSRNLIEKLEHFTSRHEANRLQRQVCVNDRVKTENLSSLYLIDDIHQAMHENQPVTFVYCEWNQNKELVPRHGGERYLVSPWMLMWEDEKKIWEQISFENNQINDYVSYRLDRKSTRLNSSHRSQSRMPSSA